MIESFFGFTGTPFSKSVSLDALYFSPALSEVLARLQMTAERQLFAVLTAEVGAGKTTAIRKFNSILDKSRFILFYMSDSQLTPRWFYKGLLEQLGVEAKYYRNEARLQLHKELQLVRSIQNKFVVTVIDEAHLLDREMMEEIRFLLNYQMDSVNPMALILVGQNELRDKLKFARYAAIRQRIDLKCSLPSLDRAQTQAYIAAHLNAVGYQSQIFSDSALDLIAKASSGSLRLTNKICTHCLTLAEQRGTKVVDEIMVSAIVDAEIS